MMLTLTKNFDFVALKCHMICIVNTTIGLIIYVSDFTSEVNNLRPPSTDDCNPPSGHQV